MTICPCCGSKTNGDWSNGCACGARPVGEPLPRPENQLPSYARALILTVSGLLMVLVLIVQTINAFSQKLPTSKTYTEAFAVVRGSVLQFWMWAAAAETAAWQLKWIAIPATLFVWFGCRKMYRSVKESPAQFCGLKYARCGFITSAAVPVLIAVLIGATVPERIKQRNDGILAGQRAIGLAVDRVMFQYKQEFGSYPASTDDLRRLPDPDGSITALLKDIEGAEYKASAEVAAVPTKQPKRLRGAVIRNASMETDEPINDSLSFTEFELRLPGYDKQLGTDDDIIVEEMVVSNATETRRRAGATTAGPRTVKQ
ncbi:MAG TPA: hypothetical protein VJV03_14920 [Pyrinomonadaceae bacterium]|nr:hypothetical protein [Pyrinomonadaceae bacterium]